MLMDQLFLIGMTLTGFGWADLMSLSDIDRIWLTNKCSEYQRQQSDEMERLKSRVPRK